MSVMPMRSEKSPGAVAGWHDGHSEYFRNEERAVNGAGSSTRLGLSHGGARICARFLETDHPFHSDLRPNGDGKDEHSREASSLLSAGTGSEAAPEASDIARRRRCRLEGRAEISGRPGLRKSRNMGRSRAVHGKGFWGAGKIDGKAAPQRGGPPFALPGGPPPFLFCPGCSWPGGAGDFLGNPPGPFFPPWENPGKKGARAGRPVSRPMTMSPRARAWRDGCWAYKRPMREPETAC